MCDENERNKETNKKKRRTCKNVIDGRREFIGRVWKSSVIDCKEAQIVYHEDTISLVNEWMGARG